jgi:Lon protease-like protein
MAETLLPLFPLGVVLLPGNRLPLHIFEERYKDMIGIVLREQREFGVVLASSGGIAASGCTAIVEEVTQQFPDGRMDIVTVGYRRFSIFSLNEEKDYLQATVNFFDDEAGEAPVPLRQAAITACSVFAQVDPTDESPRLSFQLASHIEDLAFNQKLLESRSEAERLKRLIEYAPGYEEAKKQKERLQVTAPQNGHGKYHKGLG